MEIHSGPREECGVVGVYAPREEAARLAFYGLFALQHRGQESAGMATADGHCLYSYANMGLVSQVFRELDMERLPGPFAIAHTRYSTTGSSRLSNAQPILVKGAWGEVALGHNGNVVNALELRRVLEREGCPFVSTTDSEVIAHLLASAPGADWGERAHNVMLRLQGAYSLVALVKDAMLVMRDPFGIRPLCLGRLDGGWVAASESCALDHIGARYDREVEPGEVLVIDEGGLQSYPWKGEERQAICAFEFIYFARPDSAINGKLLYPARMRMGAELARMYPVDADLVIGVPDSATAAAVGYSGESGIPYAEGLVKNRYVGRTFIEPDQRLRDMGVRLKFNPLSDVIGGRRLVVVDDSIVRATTTPHVVSLLRRAGAREVHLRICAPPIRHPCFYGVDMANRRELVAARLDIPGICRLVGADSLGYLDVPGLIRAIGMPRERFCLACFTGEYPVPVQLELDKIALEREPGAADL